MFQFFYQLSYFSSLDVGSVTSQADESTPLNTYDRKTIDLMVASGEVDFREKKVTVKKGTERLVQSPIWKTFQIIFNKETNIDIPTWYMCMNCNTPIQNKYKDGTTTKFHRHLKVCSSF